MTERFGLMYYKLTEEQRARRAARRERELEQLQLLDAQHAAAVTRFSRKSQLSLTAAEAILAHLKPTHSYRSNALRAQEAISWFAAKHRLTLGAANIVLREWAEGRN